MAFGGPVSTVFLLGGAGGTVLGPLLATAGGGGIFTEETGSAFACGRLLAEGDLVLDVVPFARRSAKSLFIASFADAAADDASCLGFCSIVEVIERDKDHRLGFASKDERELEPQETLACDKF